MIFRAHAKIYCQGSPKKCSVSSADTGQTNVMIHVQKCTQRCKKFFGWSTDSLSKMMRDWGIELFPNKNDTVWREMRGHWKRINMIFYKGNCRERDCRKWWGLRFHQSTEFTQSSSSALNSQRIQSVEEHQTLFAMGAQVVCLLIKVSYCARMCKWVHPSVFFLQAVWGCLYLLKSDTLTQSN